MSCLRFAILLSVLPAVLALYGQNKLRFEYLCADAFADRVGADVRLAVPGGDTLGIFRGREKSFSAVINGISKETGTCVLQVDIESDFFTPDSFDYRFAVTGEETDIDIKVRFYYEEIDLSKIDSLSEPQEIAPQVYVFVTKYYRRHDGVSLERTDAVPPDEFSYYEPPFFRLANYSRDTLYGEYLPGHFTGTLVCGSSSRQWADGRMGSVDFGFANTPPLPPGYSTIAMVSPQSPEGVSSAKTGNCRYELLYSTRRNRSGFTLHRTGKSHVAWYSQEKEYYRLLYDLYIE